MKNITEGIEVSYGERVAFVSDLFKGTHETLKTFHREHQKMADDLGDFLSSDRTNREKNTANLMIQIRGDISSTEKEVASLLSKFDREHKTMAERLTNFLKESTTASKKDTAALMGQIRESIELIEKETGNLLSSFHTNHQAMTKALRNLLEESTTANKRDTAKLMTQIKGDIGAIEKEVASLLSGFDKDIKEARQNWQNLVRIMAAKRAGKAVTPAKRIEGVRKEEVAEAVEAFTAGSIKEQLLRLISETASGISLPKMGTALRIPYIRLAKPVSELVNEGKVKKENSEYLKV
ncbi:hypothetical protein KKE68_05095 [Patescibacteria group bacterium]|nr:hypothetical protein [Patescibacteria group bacterium]